MSDGFFTGHLRLVLEMSAAINYKLE